MRASKKHDDCTEEDSLLSPDFRATLKNLDNEGDHQSTQDSLNESGRSRASQGRQGQLYLCRLRAKEQYPNARSHSLSSVRAQSHVQRGALNFGLLDLMLTVKRTKKMVQFLAV
jgi:hypothetical protein